MSDKKLGRPRVYNEELGDVICERIAKGESLRSICKDEGMPDKATVLRWIMRDKIQNFCDQYALARKIQAEGYIDEVLDIADDGSNDWVIKNGEPVLNSEHLNRSRLRVDSRKWVACKLLPKIYGEKISQEITGGEDGPAVVVKFISDKPLTEKEWAEKYCDNDDEP